MTDTTHNPDHTETHTLAPQVEPGRTKKFMKFVRKNSATIYIVLVPILTYNAGYNLRFGDWLGWQVLTLCGLLSLFGWMLLKQHSNALLEKAARKRYIIGLIAVALLFVAILGYRLMGLSVNSLGVPDLSGGLPSVAVSIGILALFGVVCWIIVTSYNDWRARRNHNNR